MTLLLKRALDQAAVWHRDQKRKYPGVDVPYMSHLAGVAIILARHGFDDEVVAAGALHDSIEDCGVTANDISQLFGERVSQLVTAVSENDKSLGWEERKQRYLAHLQHATADVKLISAADKLHNASSIVRDRERIGDAIYERFTPTREQTLWYYRSVVDALGTGWSHALLDELRRVVDALHDR